VVSRAKDLIATTNIGVVINDKNLLFVIHERQHQRYWSIRCQLLRATAFPALRVHT
jgi:hypothetical protein